MEQFKEYGAESAEREARVQIFRDEITELCRQNKAEHISADLSLVDPTSLTETDMAMWRRVNDGTATLEDYQEYVATFFDEHGSYRTDAAEGRQGFLHFVGNRMNQFLLRRHLEQDDAMQT